MKYLQQVMSRGRATLRRLRSVAPGGAKDQRPVLLVLRLGEGDGEGEGQLKLEDWQRIVVETVDWLGPIRVCLRGGAAHSPLLVPLVRFANRLECPTHLVTAGPLGESLALSLVDAGLAAATIRIGALDEAVHAARMGTPMAETLDGLEQLRRAREDRGRPLVLHAALSLATDTVDALGAMAGLARQTGADDLLVCLPVDQAFPDGSAAAVDALGHQVTEPGLRALLAGRTSHRPLGLRLEVLADGTLRTSRLLAPLGTWAPDSLQQLWESGGTAVTDALGLDRTGDEVERVPSVLYSAR